MAVPVATAIITTRIPPERDDAFEAWQAEISAAETRWPGFVAHQTERPVRGVQDDWIVAVSFDTPEHLDAWLHSPDRAELLHGGAEFTEPQHVTRTTMGFGFWAPNVDGEPAPDPVFKSNLLILLVLYPLVFLWGYFVSEPLIDSRGVPFWLSLFIGNVVSTQLLGWVLAPWAFRGFGWWLRRGPSWRRQLLGYVILVVLYAASMAVFAWLGALQG